MDPQNLSSQELESFNVKSCKWDILGETAPGGADDADLVVAKGLLTFNSSQMDVCLNNITTSIKDGGFVLLLESTQDCLAAQFMDTICVNCSSPLTQSNLRKNFESQGLELVAEKSDGVLSTLFLLRKVRQYLDNAFEKYSL